MQYNDKVILVTGGANGIGRTISCEYLKLGATVILADKDEEKGRQAVQEYAKYQERAVFYQVDLTCVAAIREMFQDICERYHKIDVLINNAGRSIFKPFLSFKVEEWDEVINLNLRAAFIAAQEFMKRHRENTYGRIINIASTRFLMSEPNSEAYAASKGGIVALTHALALSCSMRHMTVNAISPGWIQNVEYEKLTAADHAQHPAQRVGKPEDVFRACLFLTDEQNDFITGENIMLDGGMTKKMIYV